MGERRLHIGGKARSSGWEVLDALPGEHVDHLMNAADLSVFADGTFAEVYASHVLEHFDYKEELLATLKEWRRVLRPSGQLYVSVPDLDILARLFVERRTLSLDERFLVMRMIFGGHVDAYDYHKTGLNDEILAAFLFDAGFDEVRRVPGFGLFQDTSLLAVRGVPISLNMLARNPPERVR